MLGDYANTINAIGQRPGGLKWANSTISLGEDVVAIAREERNRLIARLESTVGLITGTELLIYKLALSLMQDALLLAKTFSMSTDLAY